MTYIPATLQLELVPVTLGAAARPDLPLPFRRDPDRDDDDLEELAGLFRASAGSTDGDRMIGELEEVAVLACAGRWTRPEMAGWTISTLVSFVAERLGPIMAIGKLRHIIERNRAVIDGDG